MWRRATTPPTRAPIQAALDDEDYRTTAFHDRVRVGRVSLDQVKEFGDPEMLFFNINVPDDVDRADELWRSQHKTAP